MKKYKTNKMWRFYCGYDRKERVEEMQNSIYLLKLMVLNYPLIVINLCGKFKGIDKKRKLSIDIKTRGINVLGFFVALHFAVVKKIK